MLEGAFNRKLKKKLEEYLPREQFVVLKHANLYTAGIPDFSISHGAKTLWVEVKREDNCCTKLQMDTLMRFGEAGLEVVFDMDGKNAHLYHSMNSACTYMTFDELVRVLTNRIMNA